MADLIAPGQDQASEFLKSVFRGDVESPKEVRGAFSSALARHKVELPEAAAKLLTSPKAVAIIASPAFRKLSVDLRLGGQIGAEGTTALSRLGAMLFAAEDEPE